MSGRLRLWRPSAGDTVIPFFEGDFDRVLRLFRAGFQVRAPRLLEPKFHDKPFCGAPEPPPSYGFVYIFPAGPLLKIGISEVGVERRWRNIKCGNALLEPPIYVSPALGKHHREIEMAAHKALAEYHESGEWFRCPREHAVETVRRLAEECIHARA